MGLDKNIKTEYIISFESFSSNLPSNLKVYYNEKSIDLRNFKIKGNTNNLYNFKWEWDYDTDNDEIDTGDSKLENISFNVVLNISNMDTQMHTLPKTGDI